MSDKPWVRFFPSDWLAGTRGMTPNEVGIYITLVAMMYEREQPIAFEETRLARLCGTTKTVFSRALDALISDGKIIKTDSGLWNKRVSFEVECRQEKSNASRESANARWGKKDNKNNDSDDANALPAQSGRNANQNQSQNIEKREAKASTKKRDDLGEFTRELKQHTDDERIHAIVKLRRSKRGAITLRAAEMFVKAANECRLSVSEAIDTCIQYNWITVTPEWLANVRRKHGPPEQRTGVIAAAIRKMERDNAPKISDDIDNVELLPPRKIYGP